MQIKAIFKFRCITEDGISSGWSEILYRNAADLNEASTFANQFGIARIPLLPNTSTLVSVTVGDVLNPRATQTTPRNTAGNSGYRTDTPWQSVLLTCSGALGGVRTYSIRNVPDSVILGGQLSNDPIADAWKMNLQGFREVMIRDAWAIRIQSKTAVSSDILRIGADGTLAAVNAFFPVAVGTKLRITRCRDTQGIPVSGVFTATAITNNGETNTIGPWVAGRLVNADGVVTVVSYVLSTIVGNNFNRIGTHKVGRPFGGLRGRRSKRKRALV